MRKMFLFIIFISSLTVKAQNALPGNYTDTIQRGISGNDANAIASKWDKKWSFSTYSSISTGFSFFNGGNAFVVAAPIGFQLNRRLNNNLYAFTGVSVAPAYMNFNRSFLSADVNKFNLANSYYNSFGMYGRAEVGLMYVNDARTFSISGSFGVQRSSNPIFNYRPMSTSGKNSLIQVNR